MYRLLLVSPDKEPLLPVRDELTQAGYQALLCPPQPDALAEACSARPPEVLFWDAQNDAGLLQRLLELFSPGEDGPAPLLVALLPALSLSSTELPEGADDFLAVPARPGEALARLAFLLHRCRGVEPDQLLYFDGLSLDLANYAVTRNGERLDLTFKEYELLRFLATHRGRVFTREMLLQQVWGHDFYGGARTVDVHIRRLRAKLGPPYEALIETVRNVGYRFGS